MNSGEAPALRDQIAPCHHIIPKLPRKCPNSPAGPEPIVLEECLAIVANVATMARMRIRIYNNP